MFQKARDLLAFLGVIGLFLVLVGAFIGIARGDALAVIAGGAFLLVATWALLVYGPEDLTEDR